MGYKTDNKVKILKLLSDNQPRTERQIAIEIGTLKHYGYSGISHILMKLVAKGLLVKSIDKNPLPYGKQKVLFYTLFPEPNIKQLIAERDRYKEALEKIAETDVYIKHISQVAQSDAVKFIHEGINAYIFGKFGNIAKTALTKPEQNEGER